MNTKATSVKDLLYKTGCWCMLAGFVFYWLFTLGLLLFNRPIRKAAPTLTRVYYSFFNQNWRLYSSTKNYSRELNFVIRTIQDSSKTDTIHLVQYFMQQKRMKAPLNTYEDALERCLNTTLTDVDKIADKKKKALRETMPGKDDLFYLQAIFTAAANDKYQATNIKNLVSFGKYVAAQQHADTVGKEFQLILVRNYIAPATPSSADAGNPNTETLFISTYKPF